MVVNCWEDMTQLYCPLFFLSPFDQLLGVVCLYLLIQHYYTHWNWVFLLDFFCLTQLLTWTLLDLTLLCLVPIFLLTCSQAYKVYKLFILVPNLFIWFFAIYRKTLYHIKYKKNMYNYNMFSGTSYLFMPSSKITYFISIELVIV